MKNSLLSFFVLLLFSTLLFHQTNAQNLIPNAGFEYHKNCPNDFNHNITLSIGWLNGSHATPDYYHPCGTKDFRTPKNRYGIQKPFEGDAYVGLNNRQLYREYINAKLKEPLKAGTTYRVSIYVSSSDDFDYTLSDIGFYFSKKRIYQANTKRIKDITPQVVNLEGNFIQKNKWKKISGKFVAKGGEKYVIIGSFSKLLKTQQINKNIVLPNSGNENTYIYVDNFSTIPLKRTKYKLPAKGKIKLLDHVYFQFGKAHLLAASHNELNKLAEILNTNSLIKIEIVGHTDNLGSEIHNLELSKKRAQAVANYLIQKGILEERVKHKGLGSKFPMVKNESNKDRQLNRRVEFKMID
jgi:OOP family OmpA-OmpF porin